MPNREPIFNFSEPAPVWLCGFLIAIAIISSILPPDSRAGIYELVMLAAQDGNFLFVDRPLGNVPALLLHGFFHRSFTDLMIVSGLTCIFGVLVCRVAGTGWRRHARFLTIFCMGIIVGGLAQWSWWAATGTSGIRLGAYGGASAVFAAGAYVIGGRSTLFKWGLVWALLHIIAVLGTYLGINLGGSSWPEAIGGYMAGALFAELFLRPNSTDFRVTR